MSARLHKLRGEQGVAIVIAITTITVTAALAAALFAAASTLLHTSSREASNKRALAAAQAGLNVGLYRFTRISASPSGSFTNNCITDKEVAWSSSTPHCPEATGYLNQTGVSSSYFLTPDMSAALSGMPTVATECASSGAGDRCLTAIGTVNGVTRRVQERVRALELFSIHGMTGLKKTEINSSSSWSGGNFVITSDTASNGNITFGENVSAPGEPYHCEYGPEGSAPCGSNNVKRTQPITVPSVETIPFSATQATNSNGLIVPTADYSSATRSLTVPAGATLELAAGDYNFCYVNLGNGATLSAPAATPAARVKIYVDSPNRAGSGCTAPNGGKFEAESSGSRLNLGEGRGQLEIYLYGTVAAAASPPPGTCNTDFKFNNTAGTAEKSSSLYIYAPDSSVSIKSASYEMGAVVACSLTYWAEKPSAHWDYPPSGVRPSNGIAAVTGSFRECTAKYSGDPESTCG
jgi:Tfp pilus assembly protein PilX